MQRQFGRMLHKSPGDNAKVAVLLTDYEDVDRVLAKIIDAAKSWRDAWVNLCSTQLGVAAEYDGLWDPIVGASDGLGRLATPTPDLQLEQALHLKEVYTELRADLLEELELIEVRVVKPATSAREYIDPLRKTIKKRENKRLDFEKVQDKTSKLQRKSGKTPKEDASLAKLEAELIRVSEDFHTADAHLRETLPPIVSAAFSMIPLLINSVVALQNQFLGLYYTALHTYCEKHGFPSPPPPMDEVIAAWSAAYEPVKRVTESITCIATGKAVRLSMKLPDDPSLQDPGRPGPPLTLTNGPRRSSSGLIPTNGSTAPPKPARIPSTTSLSSQPSPMLAPTPSLGNNYVISNNLTPTDFTTASRLGQHQLKPAVSPNSMRPRSDYFDKRPPSAASTLGSTPSVSGTSLVTGKKKPPPPPPKRIASRQQEEFVVAQYAFDGQGSGDLSFRQGDRIKIVKKTDTLDDWWVGELGGVEGSFPANYCRAG
ncbi:hypothetical protein NPX13_g10260 [Xylaria arbuscula]|uniref:SH3 domain-containing protein n=1 Tax=Xylaria arbuscula TaxID=114810 RepID=A0A9W8N554_9PEZI|nr:hypothetical protein NPX13_g10260 [Xylaria arbuscula]